MIRSTRQSTPSDGVERPNTNGLDEDYHPEVIAALVDKIGVHQRRAAEKIPELHGATGRAQHQKQILGAFGTLRIFDAIPARAQYGPFASPGKYTVACRFSNGQPCPMADQKMDVRGIAVKFFMSDGLEVDLLVTNEGGRSHARTAVMFMNIADIILENLINGPIGFLRASLAKWLGHTLSPNEEARAFWILLNETGFRKVESLATERFFGSVIRLGGCPVRYGLLPHTSTASGTKRDRREPNYLRTDLEARLDEGPIKYDLCLQCFVDEATTPVNDASVAWPAGPEDLIQVGELEISGPPSADDENAIQSMAFNPGYGFEPLGITHARKAVYEASARNRRAISSEEAKRHLLARRPAT